MQDEDDQGRDSKKHRRLFSNPRSVIKNIFFGGLGGIDSGSDDEDDDDEKSDHGSDMENDVMGSQNYFNNNPFRSNTFNRHRGYAVARAYPVKKKAFKRGMFNDYDSEDEDEPDSGEVEPEKAPWSTFRVAIRAAQ